IPKLFERFHRVPNMPSRTHEGSGIGLALVHELVKLHSGSVRTESFVGQGSTFVVSIPFGQSHLAPGQMGGSRSLSSTAVGAKPCTTSCCQSRVRRRRKARSVLASLSLTTTPTCASICPVYCRNSTKWKRWLTVELLFRPP